MIWAGFEADSLNLACERNKFCDKVLWVTWRRKFRDNLSRAVNHTNRGVLHG